MLLGKDNGRRNNLFRYCNTMDISLRASLPSQHKYVDMLLAMRYLALLCLDVKGILFGNFDLSIHHDVTWGCKSMMEGPTIMLGVFITLLYIIQCQTSTIIASLHL